ncbi:DNA/RNA non-specific endonuclease [Odoribacter lunatus]|uniref:DNA/RNA non-specific endonuclease n=1 Tax=Odoribacter lunatus TaxID=2941335 RepID=UPI00203C1485|nr:DNA/RNA non-specific endonuclease [Odoribacter lunatus]
MVKTPVFLKFIAGSVLLLAIFFSACGDDHKQGNEPEEDLTNTVPGRLGIPRLTGDTVTYKFIDHTVSWQGKAVSNYSMEYNLDLRHTRWVAFTAYDLTSTDNVSRTNAWADDPEVPENSRTERTDYSGYDRGHLVASNDRRYSREANEQTFYYSNMSPQLSNFNQGIWQKLEENVKSWMQDESLRDTLYIVKGGTIREDQVLKYNGAHSVPVPKYYFMAVLAKKGTTYKSIAFWLEHKKYSGPYDLQGKALSVDELEEKTGIDFFPLLPDVIERPIEASYTLDDWPWKNK